MKKKESPRAHSKRRLKERYGIVATDKLLDTLTERIMLGKVTRSEKTYNGANRVELKLAGRRFLLIFNPNRRQIMTFLPVDDRRKAKKQKKAKEQTDWKRMRIEGRTRKKSRTKRVEYRSLLNLK